MPAGDYQRVKELGRGAFGVVYQVRHKDGAIYAMKEMKRSANASQIQELAALHALKDHPNIIQYVEYFKEKTNMCIVMEFCNRGNLENYVIEAKRSDQLLLSFIKQMADAIQYSHSRRIVHRDLKPENVLITMNNGQLIAKIADFGLAKIKLSGTVSLPSRGLPLASYMHTQAGTYLYMAPEVYNGNYTEKADVFPWNYVLCHTGAHNT
ncbi:serine/threonine-protein kinase PDIK1L-like [Ptychodera flava]|uniref:serine/threonine-protein kinase PDIK1L-like n=1 Tax=Ptychodera flava TaxID=63121 RepID=UPI00396A02E3